MTNKGLVTTENNQTNLINSIQVRNLHQTLWPVKRSVLLCCMLQTIYLSGCQLHMYRKKCGTDKCISKGAQEYSIKHSTVRCSLGYLSDCIQDIQIPLLAA